MDTYQQFLELHERIENYLSELKIDSFDTRSMADFILKYPGKSPLQLAYKTSTGQIEFDDMIRYENLSTLIGYKISYKDENEENITVVVLFKNITKGMLEAEGCLTNATVGKLREMAKTIHPEAKIINEWIAACIWCYAAAYYTIRFLLGEKGVEIPDIQVLSSSEEYDSDGSPCINWNSSCNRWDYLDEEDGSGLIEGGLPVLCYIKLKSE